MHDLTAALPAHAIPLPAVSAPAAAPPRAAAQEHGLVFDGRAGEYFRIWIVNVALSLLTLGIYSAWAKVRTERYFYGNTRLDGVPFEYLAEPLRILRGRLIAAVLFGAYTLSTKFVPLLALAIGLFVVALMPYFIVSGLRFRARYSAWRGVRFRFHGSVGKSYANFLGWPLLSMFTFGLLYPWVNWRQHGFIVGGHAFGRERFGFGAEISSYYAVYGIAFLVLLGGGACFAMLLVGVMAGSVALGADPQQPPGGLAAGFMGGMIFLMYLGYFAIFIGMQTALTNLLWNNVSLGEHRFRSTLRMRDMVWILLSNVFAIVFSLGLLTPWAQVRLARYRAEHFAVLAQGDLEQFSAAADRRESAAGAEIGDVFDFDVSI